MWTQIKAEDKECIQFRVSDTGIGIPHSKDRTCFRSSPRRIPRLHASMGGTGLGLAITHRFVQLMKGQINVESEPGKGAVFTVQLPTQIAMETTESASSQGTSDAPAKFSENKPNLDTILVIDDDPSVRDLIVPLSDEIGSPCSCRRKWRRGIPPRQGNSPATYYARCSHARM